MADDITVRTENEISALFEEFPDASMAEIAEIARKRDIQS